MVSIFANMKTVKNLLKNVKTVNDAENAIEQLDAMLKSEPPPTGMQKKMLEGTIAKLKGSVKDARDTLAEKAKGGDKEAQLKMKSIIGAMKESKKKPDLPEAKRLAGETAP